MYTLSPTVTYVMSRLSFNSKHNVHSFTHGNIRYVEAFLQQTNSSTLKTRAVNRLSSSFRRQFFRVRWPKQQRRSTEGQRLVNPVKGQSHQAQLAKSYRKKMKPKFFFTIYTTCSKKVSCLMFDNNFGTYDRFSKFFHQVIHKKILYVHITKTFGKWRYQGPVFVAQCLHQVRP